MLLKSCYLAILALVCVGLRPACATTYVLTSGNSTLKVNDSDPMGAYDWTIDGVDLLYQQWFWFRVGNAAEQSLDKLPLLHGTTVSGSDCSPCVLDLEYQGDGFTIDIRYLLQGGMNGARTADIAESIRINNQRNMSLDFHFYQYSDFNLSPGGADDLVAIDPSWQLVRQRPERGGAVLTESVVSPKPSHAEVGVFPATVNRLNDSSPTTLNNVFTAGPGNVTWAFEWDKVIPRRGSFLISKSELIKPIPEPGPLALLAVAGSLAFARRRRFT